MTREQALKRIGCDEDNLEFLNKLEALGLIEFEKVDKRQELIEEAREWIDQGCFSSTTKHLILRLISELEKE